MQERFNKDLEEIKKSQYIMNNAINEIRNTLEATNSRIMGAEDRISEVEDTMVEISESERKKEKRIKRNEGATFTTTIQHSSRSFGHRNQSRKRNIRNPNWKRSKTLTVLQMT